MVEITQADREILAGEYEAFNLPELAADVRATRGTAGVLIALRAIAKLRAERDAARPLPREQQPGLEWRDKSLFLNDREIGDVYESERGWRYFLMSDNPATAYRTEAEARQALWDAASSWRKGTIKQDLRVHTQAGSSDSAAKRGSAGWPEIRAEEAHGDWIDHMRQNLSWGMRQSGDCRLMWVNQGDWMNYQLSRASPLQGGEK